jgi:hypothetical protein
LKTGDKHARRRQDALDAEIDHADEDDDRLADGDDDQKTRARQQRREIVHGQEGRGEHAGGGADDDQKGEGTPHAARPTRQCADISAPRIDFHPKLRKCRAGQLCGWLSACG